MDFGIHHRLSKNIMRCKNNAVIAEIKTYSPIYGDLLRDRDIFQILRDYESAGAVGISYITAKEFRGDTNTFKRICKESVLPVLRKDFIKDKREIEDTANADASSILIIPRILKENTPEFVDFAIEQGIDPLVEVHTAEDVAIANQTKAVMVGINNRDIFKLEKDGGSVEVTEKIAPLIKSKIKVSESGIQTVEQLKRALRFADAVLIGTAFMMSPKPREIVKLFVEEGRC
jgi:indole-3-glycerol phosphate synthase